MKYIRIEALTLVQVSQLGTIALYSGRCTLLRSNLTGMVTDHQSLKDQLNIQSPSFTLVCK